MSYKFSGAVEFEKFSTAVRDTRVTAGKLPVGSIIENTTTGTVQWRQNTSTWLDIGAITTSAYLYVGYADDAAGTGYSASPTGKSYVAFRTSATPLTPVVGDFAGLWRKYVGDTGSSGASLPTKRVIIHGYQSYATVNLPFFWIVDAVNLRLLPKIQAPYYNSGVTYGVAAKSNSAGKVLLQSGARVSFLHTDLSLIEELTGNVALSSFNQIGFVFDAASDAYYGISATSSRVLKIAHSNNALTENTTNPAASGLGRIAVGNNKVLVSNGTSALLFSADTMAFVTTISPSQGNLYGGTYNTVKDRLVLGSANGYIEVNPSTNAITNVTITGGAFQVAYGNAKYCLITSSLGQITLVDAVTNTSITVLTTANGLINEQYQACIFAEGHFYCLSVNSLVIINATTNAVVRVFRINPGLANFTNNRNIMCYQDVS